MDLIKPLEFVLEQSNEESLVLPIGLWNLINAARDGDLPEVKRILDAQPKAVDAAFWYMRPIHFAVREGHLELVKFLVEEKNADITESSLYGQETLLQMAVDREHAETADYLRGLFREHFSSDGSTLPIHEAAEQGDIEKVKDEIKADPNLLERGDSVGRRPLHYAVQTQNQELVDLLLKEGADVNGMGFSSDNRLGGFGFTPLALSLWWHQYWRMRNDYTIAKKLIDHGATYNITIAAALGDKERVESLLKEDKGLANFHDSSGKRPLSAASERNHQEIVEMLLDAGALPNLPDGPMAPKGYALWAAARFGYTEIAKILLEHGADPNADVESSGNPTESAKDQDMRSLLYTYGGNQRLSSHFHQGNIDTIAALLKFAPDSIDELVATVAFTHCVSSGHAEIVKILLKHGVRVPSTVNYCQSYLWHNLDLTRVLLEHDMDPNLPNWQSIRPLHYIGRSGEIEAAELFLEFGADPHAVDEEYRTTPLGWAAKNGQKEFVEYWLEKFPGSQHVDSPDIPSWATPLAWASKRGHTDIVQLLDQ